MLALRVTYLMGRVYSASFDDGDAKAEPEWLPHPSRLFSALTAAWGTEEPRTNCGPRSNGSNNRTLRRFCLTPTLPGGWYRRSFRSTMLRPSPKTGPARGAPFPPLR